MHSRYPQMPSTIATFIRSEDDWWPSGQLRSRPVMHVTGSRLWRPRPLPLPWSVCVRRTWLDESLPDTLGRRAHTASREKCQNTTCVHKACCGFLTSTATYSFCPPPLSCASSHCWCVFVAFLCAVVWGSGVGDRPFESRGDDVASVWIIIQILPQYLTMGSAHRSAWLILWVTKELGIQNVTWSCFFGLEWKCCLICDVHSKCLHMWKCNRALHCTYQTIWYIVYFVNRSRFRLTAFRRCNKVCFFCGLIILLLMYPPQKPRHLISL